MEKKLLFALSITILLCVIFAFPVYSALTASKTVTSSGAISTTLNLGVYNDSACTQPLSAINWGNLTVGSSTKYPLYIKNLEVIPQTLSMNTSNWSPVNAEQYISITWNQNNTTLSANQVVKATLTLTVSASIDANITAFSNNIIITGTS